MPCLDGEVILGVDTHADTHAAVLLDLLGRPVASRTVRATSRGNRELLTWGTDIMEVVDGAATKPFGFMRFEPGPGTGGHCLPADPFYLTWKAREYDISTEFIELAGKVNQYMPYFCLEKIERALNDMGKPVGGRRSLCLACPTRPASARCGSLRR